MCSKSIFSRASGNVPKFSTFIESHRTLTLASSPVPPHIRAMTAAFPRGPVGHEANFRIQFPWIYDIMSVLIKITIPAFFASGPIFAGLIT